jgi:hypothetical protein
MNDSREEASRHADSADSAGQTDWLTAFRERKEQAEQEMRRMEREAIEEGRSWTHGP